MSLWFAAQPGAAYMKSFPGNKHGVLLPTNDRETAALGVCMYTACRPSVLLAQRAAFLAVRRFGTKILPTRAKPVELPADPGGRAELLSAWNELLGPIDNIALYQRRQAHRSGLTMLVTRRAEPVAIIKLRHSPHPLRREQEALQMLEAAQPRSFRSPRPLGSGLAGRWHWSAQEVVFNRPHRPAMEAPAGLFDEVSSLLSTLEPSPDGAVPAHRDLTPWNLRRDHHGQIWLFDWEEWGAAPPDADRVYFSVSSRALGGPPVPAGLAREAIAYHRVIMAERMRIAERGVTLPGQIMAALDQAERAK